ncbi:site-specific integrase [Roseinatronobacter sp. NSM]|uniref:site-specific integrase n=1 Tax=Roseinatronobacter sp. NSM TaxID=3457785 RepID=UPI004035E888
MVKQGVVERTGKRWLHEPKPGLIYVRKGGRYLGQITAPENTEDFDRQYWEILSGKRFAAKTSWSELIKSYRQSYRWTKLKHATRVTYEHVLVYLETKNGSKDMTRLQRRDVIAARDANLHRHKFANDIPRVMSVLCEHAIDIGWIKQNPAKGVPKIPTPIEKQQPHIPWPDVAVEKFRTEASPRARLIFEIGVGSVQRPGDWVGFTWGDYDGDNLRLAQGKTGTKLVLPCTEALKEALDDAKARLGAAPHPSRPILTTQKGQRLTYSGLSQVMRKERRRLGLSAFDLHALRYRGVQELAWKGCTDEEIAAYSGHFSIDMIRKYAGEARQIMRARQAREKRR